MWRSKINKQNFIKIKRAALEYAESTRRKVEFIWKRVQS